MSGYLFGDLYNIGCRVKEIDSTLRITFDNSAKLYRIHRGKHQVMTVQPGQLDNRVIMALHEGDLHRYSRLEDYIEIMEAREAEVDRKKSRALSNHVESVYMDNFDQLEGIKHFCPGGISA